MTRGVGAFERLLLTNGQKVLLVPWYAVERDVALGHARALLRGVLEEPEGAANLRRLAEEHAMNIGADNDTSLVEQLAQMLASGELALVHLQDREPEWFPPYHTRSDVAGGDTPLLSELLPSSGHAREVATWIEIQCVGLAGAGYAGASVRLRLASAETVEARLDGSSTLRLDGIRAAGTCRFELLAESRRSGTLRLDERPEITGSEPRVRSGGTPISLAAGMRHVVIVEAGHVFSC